jgi:hypothetical protein
MWGTVSPDGRFVATDTHRGSGVKLWEVATRQVLRDEVLRGLPPSSPSTELLFSPAGRWLAIRGKDNYLYEVGSWKLRLRVPMPENASPMVQRFAFSPDEEIWAVGNPSDHTELYATGTGQRLAILEPPQPAMIVSLAFSPDGTTLAVLQRDRAVQLWDLREIRRQLANLGLDWERPSYVAAVEKEVKPMRFELTDYPISASRRAFLAHEIPPRPTGASERLIDLTAFYNAALTECWYDSAGGKDLSALTPGLRNLGGTLFDVRGLIQVGGAAPDGMAYAKTVKGIRVNRACGRLQFLHAAITAHEGTLTGDVIGKYRVHYDDGRKIDVPILEGSDVLDWLGDSAEELTGVVVAWTSQNQPTNQQIRLFKTTWVNPFPSVLVSSIDFLAAERVAQPFLVAITAE